jgi:hypothetical protein
MPAKILIIGSTKIKNRIKVKGLIVDIMLSASSFALEDASVLKSFALICPVSGFISR